MKRVLAISDTHCGAHFGLTPPDWQTNPREHANEDRSKMAKWAKLQRELWDRYCALLKELAPIDVVLFLGDAIDGKGKKSGGTELITTDRTVQADMAVKVFDTVRLHGRPKHEIKMVSVYGTGYHTGTEEDWENVVADKAGVDKLGSHEWPEVEGVVFDIKHAIGTSTIPHGRGTAMLRDILWNDLWAMDEMQPRASVLLRGHAHYFSGLMTANKSGFILPALCGMGSKFGSRICSGTVHWGMMHFDCNNGNVLNWDKHIVTIESQKATTTKL